MFPTMNISRAGRLGAKVALAALVAGVVQLPLTAHAAPSTPPSLGTTTTTTDSLGDDFWVAFPQNIFSESLTLYLSGAQAGTGTVAIPGRDWSAPFTITPGEVTSVSVPVDFVVTETDGVQDLGIHITATTDISAYGVNQAGGTSGAYLGLPVDSLGQRYRVLAYAGIPGTTPSQFSVVATTDDTDITVTPKNALGARPAGEPYHVTLDAGQVYQGGESSESGDVTGTVVESSAPVAVFGGSACSFVPVSQYACDHLVQQLPPTSAWGTDFLSVRFAARNLGDTYRVLANEDGTEVSVNGTNVGTLNAGEYWESILPADASGPGAEGVSIHTSKPTLVAQYGNGSNYDGSTGDPLMMLLPPAGQYLDSYTLAAPNVEGYQSYASLVVPTADVDSVVLDGEPVPAEDFAPIAGSDYSGAQLTITSSTHNVHADSPFGIQVYEWGNYDGFGFPGGMAMNKIYVDPQDPLNANNLTSSATAPEAQQATVVIPDGATVTLVDGGNDVTEVTLPGVGVYSLNTETGVITFTPALGYSGSPAPVTYRLDNGEESATGTYAPKVNAPAAPAVSALSSNGEGTAPQSATVELAEGNTVTLVDGEGQEVNQVVVEGVGTYVLNPATGVITFVADAGYSGTPDGVTYRVTDIYAQTSTSTYTPTVTKPAAPSATPLTSTGPAGATQSVTVPVPPGGTAGLATEGKLPTEQQVVTDDGIYTIGVASGVLTFQPATGFEGTAAGVTYTVTDGYGQTASSTYTPTVEPAVVPVPPKLVATAPALTKLTEANPSTVIVHCVMANAKSKRCDVRLTARINNDITEIGRGQTILDQATHRVRVEVRLNALGKALAARPGGTRAMARADGWVGSTEQTLHAGHGTKVVTKVTPVAHAVHFEANSAELRAIDKGFLAELRHRMGPVSSIVCEGYTDSSGDGEGDKALGLKRAQNTCAFLSKSLDVEVRAVSRGEARPADSSALNRRTEITLKY